ncbi:MAG: hypothetical protein OXI73_15780 [Rhodospirillales bacterium]|nr:hypothetical protein [Rhodospirillales bacterium]
MAQRTFHTSTSDDAAILKAFEAIAEELNQDPKFCMVTIQIMDKFEDEIRLDGLQNHPLVQYVNETGGASWMRVSIGFNQLNMQVSVDRDPEVNSDRISVSYRNQNPDLVEANRALAAVQRQFRPLDRAGAIERALGPEMAEFYRRREEGLARLEVLTQRIVKDTHDYRMKLDTEAAEHKQSLTTDFDEKAKALDAQHEERSAALETRAQELEKLRLELDDRSARHARRQQSRELQEKLSGRSKKFELTSETRRKRQPIQAIFVLLLAVSAGLIGHSLLFPETTAEGVALWLGLVRLPLGALGFALTSIFFIRWNDQWFRQHANQEFRFQQLALDVDRAGYVVEMLMEWQKEKSSEMPAMLVERLTTGLFTDQTTEDRVRHPTEDAISTLLKASSGVRLDVPGVGEATFTGRGLRKLDRDLNKKQDS